MSSLHKNQGENVYIDVNSPVSTSFGRIPISFQIAEKSGLFQYQGKYLRPIKESDIAERFGHSKEHNSQSFVIQANLPEKIAFRCGGSEYSLEDFAHTLGFSIEDFKISKIASYPLPPLRPPTRNKSQKQPGTRQHQEELPLKH